jgi:DNA-binding CsgD family transcriptional regulator
VKVLALDLTLLQQAMRACGLEPVRRRRSEQPGESDVWMPWATARRAYEQLDALDDAAVSAIAAAFMRRSPLTRMLAQLGTDAADWIELHWIVRRALTPAARVSYDPSGEAHVLRVELHAGLAPCAGWLRMQHWQAVHVTAPLGAPALEVLELELGPRSFVGRYRPPAVAPSDARLQRASGMPLDVVLAALHAVGDTLDPHLRDGNLAADAEAHVWSDEVRKLRADWNLTPTEARIALLVAEDRSPAGVARELERKLNTVRTHLRSIYAKTETAGQRELAERIARWRLR